jgi:branched-chain amino acid transport system ATP-binding protein
MLMAAPATREGGGGRTSAAATVVASDIRIHFEGVRAVDGVDLEIRRGEILGLIGPNGAGKTTLVNGLSGFVPLTTGTVVLDGRDITKLPAHQRARIGLVRSFQGGRVFRELTVEENVRAAALAAGARQAEARARTDRLLSWLGLAQHSEDLAGSLPVGDEKRLAVARAAAGNPRYLLLDEPAAGLNDGECDGVECC